MQTYTRPAGPFSPLFSKCRPLNRIEEGPLLGTADALIGWGLGDRSAMNSLLTQHTPYIGPSLEILHRFDPRALALAGAAGVAA